MDNFSIFKISKFDIGLIKKLFCSVAKVEPLILKINLIMLHCLVKTLSTNLTCASRKSYAVMTWTPIKLCKLVEYFVNIHLMFFKKKYFANGLQACYFPLF